MLQSVWARNVVEQQMIELEWLKKCVEHTKMLDFSVKYYLHVVIPDITSPGSTLRPRPA